ncbi:MAG TPA: 16S rRNA (guanine(966)-N(2))-methyltransferase RsmD [Alphaproteobacteria bacterium]|jgi:16S rRNA (guanine966-N2)-methyltransferase|nr:16S rRNA (guanine(966)-N(2))-methyltransferase RsmD [Alphaproteobacteria bacterium]
MRIVAGKHRGRVLAAPRGLDTRPTAARAREALFNILVHGDFGGDSPLDGAVVLDAFAGTGAFAFEALSRGAAFATLLDTDRAALAAAKSNAVALKETANVSLEPRDATRPGRASRAHTLVFLDPPYRKDLATPSLIALANNGWIESGALAIVEVGAREDFTAPDGFEAIDERTYGAAKFVLMRYHS